MTDTLQILLERLQNADGPDREIDALIVNWLGWEIHWRTDDVGQSHLYGIWGDVRKGEKGLVPFYTASLDASIELVEKVLPGWFMTLSQYENGAYVQIRRHPRKVKSCDFDSDGSTPALALLTATVQALIAEQE